MCIFNIPSLSLFTLSSSSVDEFEEICIINFKNIMSFSLLFYPNSASFTYQGTWYKNDFLVDMLSILAFPEAINSEIEHYAFSSLAKKKKGINLKKDNIKSLRFDNLLIMGTNFLLLFYNIHLWCLLHPSKCP